MPSPHRTSVRRRGGWTVDLIGPTTTDHVVLCNTICRETVAGWDVDVPRSRRESNPMGTVHPQSNPRLLLSDYTPT